MMTCFKCKQNILSGSWDEHEENCTWGDEDDTTPTEKHIAENLLKEMPALISQAIVIYNSNLPNEKIRAKAVKNYFHDLIIEEEE